MDTTSTRFTTTDLGLASLLYAKGVAYYGIQAKENTWQKELVFGIPETSLLSEWQAGTAEVNALAFWRASRTLKHDLMQGRD